MLLRSFCIIPNHVSRCRSRLNSELSKKICFNSPEIYFYIMLIVHIHECIQCSNLICLFSLNYLQFLVDDDQMHLKKPNLWYGWL